jgi:large subunit ribosomal protein L18e
MKNQQLETLIVELKKASIEKDVSLWKRLATDLEKPTRLMPQVNLSRIDRYAREGETVVVAGKVLSMGDLGKKITVAAYRFSGRSVEKILAAGGSAVTIDDLLKKNPQGSKVRILA